MILEDRPPPPDNEGWPAFSKDSSSNSTRMPPRKASGKKNPKANQMEWLENLAEDGLKARERQLQWIRYGQMRNSVLLGGSTVSQRESLERMEEVKNIEREKDPVLERGNSSIGCEEIEIERMTLQLQLQSSKTGHCKAKSASHSGCQ